MYRGPASSTAAQIDIFILLLMLLSKRIVYQEMNCDKKYSMFF